MNYRLGDLITINPRINLKKGKVTRKIAMDDISPFTRDIKSFSFSEYKGGTKFQNGDTLMARITPCLENGKTAFVNILKPGEIAFGSTEYFVLRARKKVMDPYYLYYLSITQKFREVAIKSMTGTSGRQRAQKEAIEEFVVNLPSLKEQGNIAYRLKILDDKITLNRQINANLLELAINEFQHQFGNTSGNNHIGDYISPKRGKALLKKNVVHGNVPVVAGGLKPAAYHNKSNTEAPVITISASGANAGFVQIWLQKVWSSDSSFIDTSVTNDVYFWYLLLKTRQSEIFDAQTGSAQPHIYPKHISQMPLESIDLNEVSHFNKQITPIFQKIGQNKAENGNLNKLKQVLLDQLF